MSIDLNALATWTYDAGTLTNVASQQSVEIDIAANPALHLALSEPHWKNLGSKVQYSLDPAFWLERDIDFSRRLEDPPVIGIEATIGGADHVFYSVYLLEDAPEFSALIDSMTTFFEVVRNKQRVFTKADTRQFLKLLVRILQKADLISGDIGD